MPRILLALLATLVVLIVAAVLLVPLILDKDKVVELAAQAIERETGATLLVEGELELSVFPTLGIAFTEATVTLPGSERPDLEIDAAQIGVQLLPLFSGRIEIDTVAVDGLTARLVASPDPERVDTSGFSDAELDAWYAQQRQQRAAAGEAAGAEAALALPLALNVSQLRVQNARVESLDPATSVTSVVELAELQVSGLNLEGRPVPLAAVVRLPGEQPVAIAIDGEVVIDQSSEQVGFEGLRVAVNGIGAETLDMVAAGNADLARQSADVRLELALGEMRGDGTLRYAGFESPQIDADLDLNLFDPALFALAGPEAAEAADETVDEPGGDAPLPLDALRAIDTRAGLRIASAQFGAHTVESLSLDLRAAEGVVDLRSVTGTLHGGQLEAQATFNGRHNTATLDTVGKLAGLDIARALAAGGGAALLEGTADLDWQLRSRGRTANELTAALAGPVVLAIEQVVLKGTSVHKLVCTAVALTNNERLTTTFDPDTRFTALSAAVELADGRAELSPLRAELDDISLSGSGTFDLLQQDFDATFKARLSPGLEALDPACQVSKRLTAIDFPVNCSGNIAGEPGGWCKVDTEQILTDLAVNEGRRKIEKEAGKLFRKFLGGDQKEAGSE